MELWSYGAMVHGRIDSGSTLAVYRQCSAFWNVFGLWIANYYFTGGVSITFSQCSITGSVCIMTINLLDIFLPTRVPLPPSVVQARVVSAPGRSIICNWLMTDGLIVKKLFLLVGNGFGEAQVGQTHDDEERQHHVLKLKKRRIQGCEEPEGVHKQ